MNNPQLIEEMRWQLRQIEDRRAENHRLLTAMAATGRTTAVSPDGTVTVLAGPGGVISEVRLSREATSRDATTLSRTITAAIQEAQAASARPAPPQPRQAAAPRRRPEPVEEDEPYRTVFDV